MKKLLALVLVLLTLLPIAAACQQAPSDTDGTTDALTDPTTTTDPYDHGVPKIDYKEHEFTIMLPKPEDLGSKNYNVEEDSGDSISSAIYRRNREVENMFNIVIKTHSEGDSGTFPTFFQSFAIANEDKIDLLAVTYTQSAKPLIVQDMILPWNGTPYINTDRAWWNSNITDTLSLLGRNYLLVGDINWTTMRETVAVFFNKVVADKNKTVVGDLYQAVRDHKWTYDYCLDILKGMSADNGDQVWDDKDTYGAVVNLTTGSYGLIYSCNYHTVIMDENKGPIPQFVTQKMISILENARRLLKDNNTSYSETFDFVYDSKGIPIFFDNRALLYFGQLRHGESFRDKESDYGIIPYPKYDEAQKQYSINANQWGLSCALPRTATNLERTGAILEVMSALSRKYIIPAYYEKTLMGKIKRDDESEEMLDIIFSNVIYDFGYSYLCDFGLYPVSNLWTGDSNIASWYRRKESQIKQNYWELYAHVYEAVHGVKPEAQS